MLQPPKQILGGFPVHVILYDADRPPARKVERTATLEAQFLKLYTNLGQIGEIDRTQFDRSRLRLRSYQVI